MGLFPSLPHSRFEIPGFLLEDAHNSEEGKRHDWQEFLRMYPLLRSTAECKSLQLMPVSLITSISAQLMPASVITVRSDHLIPASLKNVRSLQLL